MNCMRKKLIALILAVVSLTTSIPVNIYAADNTEEIIRQQVLSEYQNDYMYQQMCLIDPEAAEEYISDEVTKRLLPQARSSSGSIAYCFVPLIRQKETYYCGYAAMLMALYGFNKGSSVSGSNDDERQVTLANMQSDTGYNDAVVWAIVRDLNTYVDDAYTYAYTNGGTITQTTFSSRVYSSLYYNRPVILHAKTGSLAYYQGNNLNHYLVVDQINQQLGTVQIVDSHWDEDESFYGKHTETISNAYLTITSESYRYLISSGKTNVN